MVKKQQNHPPDTSAPVILAIGGSDTSGGAGIQADLRTADFFSVRCLTAIACLTSQTDHRFLHLWPVQPAIITTQINDMLTHYPIAAVKIGALGNTAAVRAVATAIQSPTVPYIIDPVLGSSAGGSFGDSSLAAAYRQHLLPGAWLVTPNRHELEALGGLPGLFSLQVQHVLVTGGDLPRPVDRLYTNGRLAHTFAHDKIPRQLHGTGCRLSTAIAALCARGEPLTTAIAQARDFVYAEISRHGTPIRITDS